MGRGLIAALAGAVVTAAVFLLNPDVDAYREAIKAQTAVDNPLAAAIGLGTLKGLAIEYHSIGVASWTTRENEVITWGALGNVWINSKE
ncbi:MAG: hypothetical protein FJ194_00110 [Gammaproteobacteria bacterium]|nr:hypothetical protein [Gammaproteobacteria bacterium]